MNLRCTIVTRPAKVPPSSTFTSSEASWEQKFGNLKSHTNYNHCFSTKGHTPETLRQQSLVEKFSSRKQVRTKISRTITIPENVTDTSLFCLPVQTNGADRFKLTLFLISRRLKGVDARINK
jgi:hypothetical protein